MGEIERIALIVGDEPERVERFVAPLRRANLSVRRCLDAAEAERLARQDPTELLVVVMPAAGADELLRSVRSAGSPSRRAGIVLVAQAHAGESFSAATSPLANTLLPGDSSPEDFRRAVSELLEVAPRTEAPTGTQIDVWLHDGTRLELEVDNLSASGVLARTPRALAVGTTFGFALDLPSQSGPVRGRARVVRVASENGHGGSLVGARFIALGGDGTARLEEFVARSRAGSRRDEATVEGDAASGAPAELDAERIARCREELSELTPLLDELLERGLIKRLVVADWYVTGAELGLESLRSFSTILTSIYEDRAISSEAARRMADLHEVRRQLAEFGRPLQDVETRVKILLALRPALERLLRELTETAATAGAAPAGYRYPGIVTQVAVDIKRLVGARRALARLVEALEVRQKLRYSFGRGGARRGIEQIRREFAPLAASFGVNLSAETLRERRRLREAARATDQATRDLDRRLRAVHQRIFSLRFRKLATEDHEADLEDPKLHRVLVETLASGAEYLARAYGAYRHALEAIGSEPALIDRAERLGTVLAAADRAAELASTATLAG